MTRPFEILGEPATGGILIVGDHASNFVPDDIDLGLDKQQLLRHIAWDIGVRSVAQIIAQEAGFAAILGGVSRLVVDLNREAHEDSAIPQYSDGIEIAANRLTEADRKARLDCYFHPYHDELAGLIASTRPSLLLSLHSFTPQLESNPKEKRPWDIGVLYNDDDRAARMAIPSLEGAGLIVGDQLPYSGKLLNATMNRHGEGNGLAYLGIEMRQDLVEHATGQARFARVLTDLSTKISESLGAAS